MPIRRSLLFAFATLTIAGPLAHTQTTLPLTSEMPAKPLIFATASLQPNPTHQYNGVDCTADGANATGISLQNIIRDAITNVTTSFGPANRHGSPPSSTTCRPGSILLK